LDSAVFAIARDLPGGPVVPIPTGGVHYLGLSLLGTEGDEIMAMAENSEEPRTTEEDERLRELIASGASLSEIADILVRAKWATKARTEPLSHASSKLPVNKLTWAQAGLVTAPGRYMFKFGWLMVTAEDLAVWKQFPSAAFTLFGTSTRAQQGGESEEEARDEYRLGTFELRENISLSEK
jgi:hypothetical protein